MYEREIARLHEMYGKNIEMQVKSKNELVAQVANLNKIIEDGTKRLRDLENQVEMLTITNNQLIEQMNQNQSEHINYVPKLKQKII